jgi:hypothetical protein
MIKKENILEFDNKAQKEISKNIDTIMSLDGEFQ